MVSPFAAESIACWIVELSEGTNIVAACPFLIEQVNNSEITKNKINEPLFPISSFTQAVSYYDKSIFPQFHEVVGTLVPPPSFYFQYTFPFKGCQ